MENFKNNSFREASIIKKYTKTLDYSKIKYSKKVKEWYHKHLGFNTDDYGATFWWKDVKGNDCSTQWSPFSKETSYFEPSKKEFMQNFRVHDLESLLKKLSEWLVDILDNNRFSITYDTGFNGVKLPSCIIRFTNSNIANIRLIHLTLNLNSPFEHLFVQTCLLKYVNEWVKF